MIKKHWIIALVVVIVAIVLFVTMVMVLGLGSKKDEEETEQIKSAKPEPEPNPPQLTENAFDDDKNRVCDIKNNLLSFEKPISAYEDTVDSGNIEFKYKYNYYTDTSPPMDTISDRSMRSRLMSGSPLTPSKREMPLLPKQRIPTPLPPTIAKQKIPSPKPTAPPKQKIPSPKPTAPPKQKIPSPKQKTAVPPKQKATSPKQKTPSPKQTTPEFMFPLNSKIAQHLSQGINSDIMAS